MQLNKIFLKVIRQFLICPYTLFLKEFSDSCDFSVTLFLWGLISSNLVRFESYVNKHKRFKNYNAQLNYMKNKTHECGFIEWINGRFLERQRVLFNWLPKIDYYFLSVHFGGGITGVVLIAFLDKDDGILFNWDRKSGLVSIFSDNSVSERNNNDRKKSHKTQHIKLQIEQNSGICWVNSSSRFWIKITK